MNNKHSKNSRTLSMYVRLCAGKRINKAEEANRFGVDERSIQRDIDDIRAFLEDQKAESTAESRARVQLLCIFAFYFTKNCRIET